MLETERLILAPLKYTYVDPLFQLCCKNKKAMEKTMYNRCLTLKEFIGFLDKFIISRDDKFGFWVFLLKKNNTVIGFGGLLKCRYLNIEDYEIGFILDDKYWCKGFATEVGQFQINYAFHILNLHRVLATAHSDNLTSQNVLHKLGMIYNDTIKTKTRGTRLLYKKYSKK